MVMIFVMEDDTNFISKILYTILIILICVILGIYVAKCIIGWFTCFGEANYTNGYLTKKL